MKEVLEKLEEYRDKNLVEHDSEMANHCKQDCNDANDCTLCVWDKAIEIVKQTAEEYNNGWIPVSERLPDYCGYTVLLTVENKFGQRRVCKAFSNYMKEGKLLFYTNEKEYCQELTSSKLSDAWKPIAWQPLPEPYQPKGE